MVLLKPLSLPFRTCKIWRVAFSWLTSSIEASFWRASFTWELFSLPGRHGVFSGMGDDGGEDFHRGEWFPHREKLRFNVFGPSQLRWFPNMGNLDFEHHFMAGWYYEITRFGIIGHPKAWFCVHCCLVLPLFYFGEASFFTVRFMFRQVWMRQSLACSPKLPPGPKSAGLVPSRMDSAVGSTGDKRVWHRFQWGWWKLAGLIWCETSGGGTSCCISWVDIFEDEFSFSESYWWKELRWVLCFLRKGHD